MSIEPEPARSRRELMRALARWAALGGLALAGGWLVARRREARGTEGCAARRACRGCPMLRRCGLPQAAAARRATERG